MKTIFTKSVINEIKNQHVHILWAIILSYIAGFFLPFWCIFFTGTLTGLIVEAIQYIFFDKRELKLKDRALDLSFWSIGSVLYNFAILIKAYGI